MKYISVAVGLAGMLIIAEGICIAAPDTDGTAAGIGTPGYSHQSIKQGGGQPTDDGGEQAGASVQTWWQALVRDVVVTGLTIFAPVLAALLFWLLRRLGLKVELETLDDLAEKARNYAEHKADLWFKENGTKSSGAQKEDWAWELVDSVDRKLKLKRKASAKLRALILAKVGEHDSGTEKRSIAIAAKPATPPPLS